MRWAALPRRSPSSMKRSLFCAEGSPIHHVRSACSKSGSARQSPRSRRSPLRTSGWRRRCARHETRSWRSRRRSTGWHSRRPASASSLPSARTTRRTSSPAAARCGSTSAPTSTSRNSSPARRSCSTRRSTSSSPRVTRPSARSSCSRSCSPTASAPWRSRTPMRAPVRRSGDPLLLEPRSGYVYERIPKAEVEELILEEVPDIAYTDIGGLGSQIEQIRDAIELPYLHADLYKEHQLRPPKGVLLYGPPGCGKTLIAKAVANSLAKQVQAKAAADSDGSSKPAEGKSFFLNIKGPELLNKYVGETERHIRLVFQRAREKASEGMPVIVFFDEMDSIFRTRGSGVSSDVENTIVPQLLSEIDGVEGLENVIVIGASNREDMIDPAILRPGRLDVKIKIERPDAEAARDIFSKYVVRGLPLHHDDLAEHGGSPAAAVGEMIQRVVERMYSETEENRFLEVTYANGDKEVLYFKDFNSGAMIEKIVARAKKMAIKEFLETRQKGIRIAHLLAACVDEFSENEDLPNTTNPDDWARISGKKGERIDR